VTAPATSEATTVGALQELWDEDASTRPLTRALLGASLALRMAFLLVPFELHGISDFHGLGQQMLHGALPYRDFTFEYPPLAAPVVFVGGLVPAGWTASIIAALALLAEVALLRLLRGDRAAIKRYLVMTLPLTPLLSGGFDAVVVLALAAAMLGAAAPSASADWSAAAGTLVKLFPAAWYGARRPSKRSVVPLVAVAVGLALPLLFAPFDDTYLGFAARRGVHHQAVAASVHTLLTWARGADVSIAFRFNNDEIDGAGTIAAIVFALTAALAVAVLARSWRLRPAWPQVDPVLATHAMLLCALCAGKVLSPQYILAAVPSAVLLGGRRAVAWGVIGAVTILPFSSYSRGDGFMAVIAVRNALLVAETLTVAWLVLRPRSRAEGEPLLAALHRRPIR
jgi:hypothetical protein